MARERFTLEQIAARGVASVAAAQTAPQSAAHGGGLDDISFLAKCAEFS